MLVQKDYKFWFCTGSQDLYGDECMAPCNNTCTVFICICFVEGSSDYFIRDQGWFPDYFVWKNS